MSHLPAPQVRMFLQIGSAEFTFIQHVAAVMGCVLGVVQMLLWIDTTNHNHNHNHTTTTTTTATTTTDDDDDDEEEDDTHNDDDSNNNS